ncbi:polysaccharide deacetylase family protein [Cellulomonas soli]|uniref:polysaccharide deacetylase family protein n=1 Tax=Cellulomonas soli TaxID=931535 RepID=UPI003F837B63
MSSARSRLPGWARTGARRAADAVLGPVLGSVAGGRRTDRVAITFDDGPDASTTAPLLDLLEQEGVHCTFFLLVRQAEQHPDLVRAIRDRGHEIALHGIDHRPLTSWRHTDAVRMLRDARHRLEVLTGAPVTRYRPPYGKQTPASWVAARRAGLEVVVWSADAADWVDRPATEVAATATERLRGGGILLLHERVEPGPAGEPVSTSFDRVAMARQVLHDVTARGWSPVTVAELVRDGGARRTAWFGH